MYTMFWKKKNVEQIEEWWKCWQNQKKMFIKTTKYVKATIHVKQNISVLKIWIIQIEMSTFINLYNIRDGLNFTDIFMPHF